MYLYSHHEVYYLSLHLSNKILTGDSEIAYWMTHKRHVSVHNSSIYDY